MKPRVYHYFLFCLIIVILIISFSQERGYALMAETTLGELTEVAESIIIGDVTDIKAEWNPEHTSIYSDITISVEGYLKGTGQNKKVIRVPGGVVGDVGQWVSNAPVFRVGERVALFLKPDFESPPRLQGKFTIKDGVVTNMGIPLGDFVNKLRNIMKFKSMDSGKDIVQGLGEVPFEYCITGIDWTYLENPMGEYYYVNPNTLDVSDELEAVKNAASTWSSAGACFQFSYGGTTSNASTAFDGDNVVFWGDGLSYPTLAQTTTWYDDVTGNVLECDMEFNRNIAWSTSGDNYDVETVALHEFGHFLVLCHSSNPEAVMYSYYQGVRRSLHLDDVNGIQYIYGICPSAGLTITKAWITDLKNVPKNTFSPGEGIRYKIRYTLQGDSETKYKTVGMIKANGAFTDSLRKVQSRYPGGVYRMNIDSIIPLDAIPGEANITYIMRLKKAEAPDIILDVVRKKRKITVVK
jgi:hypothetical protein